MWSASMLRNKETVQVIVAIQYVDGEKTRKDREEREQNQGQLGFLFFSFQSVFFNPFNCFVS